MDFRISLIVNTSDDGEAARVTETLARTAAGLAMEGIRTALFVGPDDDLEDE